MFLNEFITYNVITNYKLSIYPLPGMYIVTLALAHTVISIIIIKCWKAILGWVELL